MRNTIAFAFVFLIATSFYDRVHADVVQAYYDQASWDAAVAGLSIGNYLSGGTKTLYDDTISTSQPPCIPPAGLCVLNTTVTTSNFGVFDSLDAIMSYPNMCTCTRTQKVVITFNEPISGFEVVDNSYNFHAMLQVNGFDLPLDEGGGHFFGLVGPISSLTFTVLPHTDNPGDVHWTDFRAVTIPEPLTISLFGAGLIGIAAMRRKKPSRG
jgi:hypothetical protein